MHHRAPAICSTQRWLAASESFDDSGVRHSHGLAHRLHFVAATLVLKRMEHCRHHAHARSPERVPKRDRIAARVQALRDLR